MRVVAFLLLLLEIGLGFIYGFGSQFDTRAAFYPTTQDNSSIVIYYMLAAILAILGWGLIIAYSENSAISGLVTTLLSVGIFVQLGPPLKAFWSYLYDGNWQGRFNIGMFHELEIMFGVTSLLVAFCFLSGRMGLAETISMILVYCAGWHANYQLIFWLKSSKFAGEIENSDSVGGNSIYLFAAVVGLIVSLFLGLKPGRNTTNTGSRQSALIALMGTGFVFAAAPFSGLQFATTSGLYEFPLNVYFALTASVATTYAFSALFGDYRIGIRESLVGVLGGVAMIASVASYINNIGGCLALGALAGLVSGMWLRIFHPRINSDSRYDQLGLIGPVLINSILGSFAVAPILFMVYKSEGFIPS